MAVGRRVRLEDAEGNACDAQVIEVGHDLITLRPDWTTWSAPSC
jgi:hypothetical protein